MANRRPRRRSGGGDKQKQQPPKPSTTNAAQFMNLSDSLVSPRRGTKELLKLYSNSPWLRAIVGKISRAVAEIDWVLLAKRGANGRYVSDTDLAKKNVETRSKLVKRAIDNGEVDKITSHPILDLFERGTGNPRLNGFACFQVTQEHLDLVGEAFWLLEKDSFGTPVTFWPIPPSWVNSLPTEYAPYYEISAPGGLRVQVPPTMIVPFIDPDPENPYGRGVSISNSLDDELQIDEWSAKHQKAFFLNRARPDLIISGAWISPQDSERLERQWMADHQGFWKAFKPLFFSQKVDVKELSQSFESMQMVQVRKHERDTFISVFGAPPEKFGLIGESKRSTIQAADFFWAKDVIKPRVEALRRSIQNVLAPMFDERLIVDFETPVIQDDEFTLSVMQKAPWSATINEWREFQGRDSLGAAGEALVVPTNVQIVPLKDGDGNSLNPQEVVEETLRGIRARGQNAPEVDHTDVAKEVATEVADSLSGLLEDLKPKRQMDE